MPASVKQQSNPFSTGGGGPNFETRVQAAFTVLMMSGRVSPCLPPFPIVKLKLQGRYAGFHTDDFIVFAEEPHTGQRAKLLAQIKHDVSITANDATFAEVIHSAWSDFNGEDFIAHGDTLALITGPLSATDINNVRPILEWARFTENEVEFFAKLNSPGFSSEPKRQKLEAFKTHLVSANNGNKIDNQQLWKFLKAFHLIGYDLDTASGSTLSLIHSLIARYSKMNAATLWGSIVDFVQTANENAGTLTPQNLPEHIRSAFDISGFSSWFSDVEKLTEHGNYILQGIRTTVGGTHIPQTDALAQLLNLVESDRFIFVTGERGSGKSSLVREFHDHVSKNSPVFCLRTEDLDKAHLDNVFSTMGIQASLKELNAGFALMPKKYLIVESLEKLLELSNTQAFIDLLNFVHRESGWVVVATGRDYAYPLITFHYLQPFGVSHALLKLEGFTDDQVASLCGQLDPLLRFSSNPRLKRLLKSPFFADLAYRVLETGAEFTTEDGEKEFRTAVWRDVIAKEQIRTNGMPTRRRQTFVDIAVKRAKLMIYGVSEAEFDREAVLKLEEDNLVRRNIENGLVSPAHDVLEDWALDQYIEDLFQKHRNLPQDFLEAIGDEPAVNRAYRLWLYQKLRYGENVRDFVLSILNDHNVKPYWQDATIAAVLQGDMPDEFLKLLSKQLFENNGALLKRFCFVLRIACQTPDQETAGQSTGRGEETLVDTLFLKPHGSGWKTIISFLLENKNSLPGDLFSHVVTVLDDWTATLHLLDEVMPLASREAGLLALHLLDSIKDSYSDDGHREKLVGIILKTAPAIREEFLALLDTDVFNTLGKRRRPRYVDDLCEMAFSGITSPFLCKHYPDILIKLAYSEWFIDERDEDDEPWSRSFSGDIEGYFGLHRYKHEFFPASGNREPFHSLYRFHLKKALDFTLDLLNTAAEAYAHSSLDSAAHSAREYRKLSEPQVDALTIQLNDGREVRQYYSGRLWSAYRGHSVVPYLLQSALMAFENWLISYAEHVDSDKLETVFAYVLRQSNSVMPTAVLASVANGFPIKVGKAALPLLRTYQLYFLDSNRCLQERAESEANWFAFSPDPWATLYAEERRTAALRSWRKESLESLIARLQFSEYRDGALSAIDILRSTAPSDERMRFLLHRIDSRDWKPIVDRENNQILFEPKHVEPDLEALQQQSQENLRLMNRFSALWLWATKTLERELLDASYYATWNEALAAAKELLEELKKGAVQDLAPMYFTGIVTAAAVFIRDYSTELAQEDVLWCLELIVPAVSQNAESINVDTLGSDLDHDGSAVASTVLPILLDYASESDNEQFVKFVKELIVTALTHAHESVRHRAAEGVREFLWNRNVEFAQTCFSGMIEYARIENRRQRTSNRKYSLNNEEEEGDVELRAEKDKFRDRVVRGDIPNNSELITFHSHSAWHLLVPCLMIPDGSTRFEHISLLSQMLSLFFEAEQEKDKYWSKRDNEIIVSHEISSKFTSRFVRYLLHLDGTGVREYIKQLREGCHIAPDFINYLLLCLAVETEKEGQEAIYWQFWHELSQEVQAIAIEIAYSDSNRRQQDKRRKLLRGLLKADVTWQKIDFERQDIADGKELILEFAAKAGHNTDVFEALARLI